MMSTLYARVYHRLSKARRYAPAHEWQTRVQTFCARKLRRAGGF